MESGEHFSGRASAHGAVGCQVDPTWLASSFVSQPVSLHY